MNLERYEFVAHPSGMEFEFVSDGPNGSRTKKVQFRPRIENGVTSFNLAFGDWDEQKKRIDDLARTDNHDAKKVLATVAYIVLSFTEQSGEKTVFARGSTPARTRLYQMGIVAHYQEIENLLNIYGYKNNEWQLFKKGVNYEAFAVRWK
jgi:hypothetical protein